MDFLDYKTIKWEYEERRRWLNSMYGKPSDNNYLRRISNGARRRVVKFTTGRVSFGQQVRVRSRISAPTAE